MDAKLTVLGYQFIGFFRALQNAAARENEQQIAKMISVVVESFKMDAEYAENNPLNEITVEISEAFWKLIKPHFYSLEGVAGIAEPRERLERSAIAIFTEEIEAQLSAEEAKP